jgi:tetratricopeptide (TPR) repeat protein
MNPMTGFLKFFFLFVLPFSFLESCSNTGASGVGDSALMADCAKANNIKGAEFSKKAMMANNEAVQNPQKLVEVAEFFKQAQYYFHRAIEFDKNNSRSWSNLGTTYFFMDDPKQALGYFLHAVQLKSDYTEAWFNVGMAYDKLNNSDSAKYALKKSIQCDSTYVSAYEQLSRIYVAQGYQDSAIVFLHIAAKEKPDSDAPYNDLAKIYFQLRDTTKACEALEKAAEINPHNTNRLFNLATYFKLKNDVAKYNYYMDLYDEESKKVPTNGNNNH